MAQVGKFGDFSDGMLLENTELMTVLKSNDGSMTRSQFIDHAVSTGMKKTTAGAYWQRNKKYLGAGEGSANADRGRRKQPDWKPADQTNHRVVRDEVRAMMKDMNVTGWSRARVTGGDIKGAFGTISVEELKNGTFRTTVRQGKFGTETIEAESAIEIINLVKQMQASKNPSSSNGVPKDKLKMGNDSTAAMTYLRDRGKIDATASNFDRRTESWSFHNGKNILRIPNFRAGTDWKAEINGKQIEFKSAKELEEIWNDFVANNSDKLTPAQSAMKATRDLLRDQKTAKHVSDNRLENVIEIDFAGTDDHFMRVWINKTNGHSLISHGRKSDSNVQKAFSNTRVKHDKLLAEVDRLSYAIKNATTAPSGNEPSFKAAGDAAQALVAAFDGDYTTGQVESSVVSNGWDAIIAVDPGQLSFVATFYPNIDKVEFFSVINNGGDRIKKSLGMLTYIDNVNNVKKATKRLIDALDKQNPQAIPGLVLRSELEKAAFVIRQDSLKVITDQHTALMKRVKSLPEGSRNRRVLDNLLADLRHIGDKVTEMTNQIETSASLLH